MGSSEYSDKEKKERFEAALKGARIAGHKPMESLIKKPKAKKAAKKAKAKKA